MNEPIGDRIVPRHYVIHGAGAVGGSMGALLARSGCRVTLVARPAVVGAIQARGGISLVTGGEETIVPLGAVTSIDQVSPDAGTRLFLCMKAGDLLPALPPARAALGESVPAVTW